MSEHQINFLVAPDSDDVHARLDALWPGGSGAVWPTSFPGVAKITVPGTRTDQEVRDALVSVRGQAAAAIEANRRRVLEVQLQRRIRLQTLSAMREEALAEGRTQEVADLDVLIARS